MGRVLNIIMIISISYMICKGYQYIYFANFQNYIFTSSNCQFAIQGLTVLAKFRRVVTQECKVFFQEIHPIMT